MPANTGPLVLAGWVNAPLPPSSYIAFLPVSTTIDLMLKKIGRYQIIRELERGGMATVYLARDQFSGRQVAVKLLPPQFTHDPRLRTRFKREAKAIAALEHAYIVPVYDFGEDDGLPYIVMRYMPGGTLAEWITGKPMPLEEAVPIVRRLAEALDTAHRRGIIHRDLKPRNVLFDDEGQAFLSDFGLAKLSDGAATVSSMGMFGTPAYMSPEQAAGDKKIDSRSDVYALGLVVYEMLCGQRPFNAETPLGLMLKHVNEPVPPLDVNRLNLPPKINDVLAMALAKKPEERYSTANALAEKLAELVGQPVKSAEPRRLMMNDRRRFNLWWIGGIGLVGGVLAVVMGGIWFSAQGAGRVTSTPTGTQHTTTPPPVSATQTLTPTSTPIVPTTTLTAVADTPTPIIIVVTVTATDTPTVSLTPTITRTPTRRPATATVPPTNTLPPPPTDTPAPAPTNPPPPSPTITLPPP